MRGSTRAAARRRRFRRLSRRKPAKSLPKAFPPCRISPPPRATSIASRRMKIATFNINNINRRLPNLLRWLRAAKPDVVCLQELKAADDEFSFSAIEKAGYHAVWRGQKTWNG